MIFVSLEKGISPSLLNRVRMASISSPCSWANFNKAISSGSPISFVTLLAISRFAVLHKIKP
jgi:hypothetical protein